MGNTSLATGKRLWPLSSHCGCMRVPTLAQLGGRPGGRVRGGLFDSLSPSKWRNNPTLVNGLTHPTGDLPLEDPRWIPLMPEHKRLTERLTSGYLAAGRLH